jgi:hypothetical protein
VVSGTPEALHALGTRVVEVLGLISERGGAGSRVPFRPHGTVGSRLWLR